MDHSVSQSSTTSGGSGSSDIQAIPYHGEPKGDENLTHQKITPAFINAYYAKDEKTSTDYFKEESKPKETLWRKALAIIWPNYVLDHLDYASFKTVVRTWFQVWVGALLCVIPLTSHWLGNAAYLIHIMGFIAAAGGSSIILNIMISFICFFYCMVGWLHGIIAMKIGNILRDSITSEQLTESLINEGLCTLENIEQCLADQVFTGRYITTKVSAIYCLALISGMTVMGLSQKFHPVIRLGFITGVITLVINCCYGVFFPIFDPKVLGLVVVKPMGVSFALKIVTAMVVYPTTSSYLYFGGSTKILKALKTSSENHIRLFKSLKPSVDNFSNYKNYSTDVTGLRGKIGLLEILAATSKFEISYGRFDIGDIGEFRSLSKNLISLSSGYSYFYQMLDERRDFALNIFSNLARRNSATSIHQPSSTTGNQRFLAVSLHDSYKAVGEYEHKKRINVLRKRVKNIDVDERIRLEDLDNISDTIKDQFLSILEASDMGLGIITSWLAAANDFRIYSLFIPGQYKAKQQKQRELHDQLLVAKSKIQHELDNIIDIENFEQRIKSKTRNEETLLCLLNQTCLFIHLVKGQCKQLLKIMDLFLSIDETRPVPTLITWFTKSKREAPDHIMTSQTDITETPTYLSSEIQERDPDTLPPSNLIQAIGTYFVKLYKILSNDHLWFWIRSGGLVCIGASPYFVRTTAHWYYSNRLIWLVIMIGVSTSESVGETLYVFWAKLFYSFFGCLLGMVGWYISAGKGNGNYYGFLVVCAVLFLYLSYYRHFSVHLSLVPAILFGVTTSLVLGTSWVDGQYNKLANVGEGFRVAYLRFISVVIGLSIGFFACLVPKPLTSKHELRHLVSGLIHQTGNIHCDVSKFALLRLQNPNHHVLRRHDLVIERFRYVLLKLAKISPLMVPLHHEIPLTGYWPEKKYKRLQVLLIDITQLYFLLLQIFDQLEDPQIWIPKIIRKVGWIDSSLVADTFSIVHMASDAIKNSNSLPRITEANLSLKHADLLMKQWGINKLSLNERYYQDDKQLDSVEDQQLQDSIMGNIDYEAFFSNDGQSNVVALLYAHMIYKRFDELMIIVKGLVGEKYDYDSQLFEEDEYDVLIGE
ncbi:hypothetical protein DFJ63DRAFT_247994 [Scheffersomyces coipomensis]|uniref:uncharacterized protein n=1 Tax=Scheffersomyces coipomensis TaxID=1788519 RepID=UPI00315DB25B